MSDRTQLAQATSARKKLCAALRDPSAKQFTGSLGAWMDDKGPVCFAGMIERLWRQEGRSKPYAYQPTGLSRTRKLYALSATHMQHLINLNDQGATFQELATELENLPFNPYV